MNAAKRSTILALAIAFVGMWAVLAASATAVWLTEEVRVVWLVAIPTVLVAGLLVVYFEWRTSPQRQPPAQGEDCEHLDEAA